MDNGRLQYIGIPTPIDTQISVFHLYGWTGAHTNSEASCRTSDLFEAMFQEVSSIDTSTYMILGDFNCDSSDLPPLTQAISDSSIISLGDCAHLGNKEFTCFPYKGTPSVRDYVMVSPSLLPFVHTFHVIYNGLPVHRTLVTTHTSYSATCHVLSEIAND